MSCNSLYESADYLVPLQDNAASTSVAVFATGSSTTDGTLQGGDNTGDKATTGPGKGLASGITFNGIDDRVAIAEQSLSGEFTVGAWVRTDSAIPQAMIGHSADSNKLNIANPTTMFIRALNGGSSSGPLHGATLTAWNHIAIKRNSSDIVSLWVNGSEASSDIFSAAQVGASDWDRIGWTVSGTQWLNGELSGVLIDGADVDLSEIAAGFEPKPSGTLNSDGSFSVSTTLGPAFLSGVISGSNGTVVIETRLVDSTNTILDTDTGSTGTFTTTPNSQGAGIYYLEVRASNDGGYDVGDSPVGAESDGWYRVASVEISMTYQELLTDPNIWAHYPLEESDDTDNSYYDSTGQRSKFNNMNNVTPTPTDQSTQPAVEGVEPFAAWRTGWWKMTPGTYQKIIDNDSPETHSYGDQLTVAFWAWFGASQTFTYGTIYRSGSENSDTAPLMIRTADTANNIDVYWRDEDNAVVRHYRTTNSPAAGGWIHIATTYDADTNETAFYINGVPATASLLINEASFSPLDPVNGFRAAGTRPDAQQRLSANQFGMADHFTFTRALSQAEIQSLMNGPSTSTSEGLKRAIKSLVKRSIKGTIKR